MADKTLIKGIICYFAVMAVMIVMFLNISLELCDEWQMPKDRHFLLGVIFSLILVYLLRQISFKKYEVWATVIIGLLIIFLEFKHKEISTATYGEDYFWVFLFTRVIWVLFIGLMVDLFRPFQIGAFIKEGWWRILIYAVLVVILVTTDRRFIIPTLCPALAYITTKFTNRSRMMFLDCMAVSFYIVFVYLMIKSRIVAPDVYENGRYMGVFLSVENIGSFCGLAFICAMYFLIRAFWYKDKKWYMIVILSCLMLAPLYFLLAISSRTTEVAVVLVTLLAFVFMHGKTKKGITLKRLFVALVIFGGLIITLWSLAKYFDVKVNNGEEFPEDKQYVIEHLIRLVDNDTDKSYFEHGSILNALDGFSSARVRCWFEAAKQIEFKGHPYEVRGPLNFASPHNFFIQKMIEMGWVKGIVFHMYLIIAVIIGLMGCINRKEEFILPTLFILYSIPVLASTILSWYSLLSFLLIQFSCLLMFGIRAEEDQYRF